MSLSTSARKETKTDEAHDETDHELLERLVDKEDGDADERHLARALEALEPEAREEIGVDEETEVWARRGSNSERPSHAQAA